jgi:hypothetical protein
MKGGWKMKVEKILCGNRLSKLSGICALLIALLINLPAQATTITFTDFQKFSGGADRPNVTATIEDTSTAGTVQITMSASTLVDNGKVFGWYFNVGLPGLSRANFAYSSGVVASSILVDYSNPTNPTTLKADGDGYFDILFSFPGTGVGTFDAGEQSIYTVTHAGLTAEAFKALSSTGGGQGVYYSVVKQSSWWGTETTKTTAVPEAGTLMLLGPGLIGIGLYRWRRKKG